METKELTAELKPYHRMQFSMISRTSFLMGFIDLYGDAIGV